MKTLDLVVRGGTIGGTRLDVGIEGEQIVAVEPELSEGATEFAAEGLLVLPGVIDAHVHFNDPGRASWEGCTTGTRAAAAGGTTCAVDMPLNAHPPTVDRPSFAAKAAALEGRARIDMALWGGLVPTNLGALEELAELGVVGFKAFMCPSGIDDFESVDPEALGEGMRLSAGLGLPVAVHAESPAVIAHFTDQALREGRRTMQDYLSSRPLQAELEAIAVAIGLAGETGCALHVVHVSCAAGVQLVTDARAAGVDVTCETCPHYLLLNADDAIRMGAIAKCAPPLREEGERVALVSELLRGTLDTMGSDHSPSPPELKRDDDAFASWGGIAGVQTLLVALVDLGLDPDSIARVTGSAVATRLGLARKGRIAPGYDADLVLVDPDTVSVLSRDDLEDRHRLSPFVGRTLRGRVVRTILSGRTVYRDGRIIGPPSGRLIRRSR